MTDPEYVIWRRRLWFAGNYANEARTARANGNEALAKKLQKQADGFAKGADELTALHKGHWVLTLPRPSDSNTYTVIFRGKKGITDKTKDAKVFKSYVDALAARSKISTGIYYLPEPLDYHQRQEKERGKK